MVIFVCLLLCLAALIYPIYVIRPFRAQGPRELMAALMVLRFRLPFVAVCTFAAVAALVLHWRRESRWLRRAGSLAGAVAVAGVALLCRINIYEMMFHPFERPSFSAAGQVKLGGNEKVISVNDGKVARAYPIRVVSYHHIINDDLAGVPIAATY
jgi:hypothetical protein